MFDRRLGIFAAGLSSVLMLSACGGDGDLTDDGGENDEAASECDPGIDPPEGGEVEAALADPVEPEGEDETSINMGLIPWEEGIAVTNMWYVILEEKGYDPEITDLDVAPVFQGLDNGDLDVFFDLWLPQTHVDYWEEYGETLEHIGPWYDNAILTLTVPEYLDDINSIDDLRDNADMFDNRIVGIESGSGLFRTTQDFAIPGYCLDDDYELVESSTAAMLAELDTAYQDEEPVVVTLWRPHIAYAQYDLKDLEDPEGMMGGSETIDTVAREGFSEDYPHFRNWLDNFELNDEELGDLEYMTLDEYEDDPQEGARQWLAENQEFLERTLGDDAEGLEF